MVMLILAINLFASDYKLGHGVSLSEYLKIGGYISSKYKNDKKSTETELDDAAIIGYGNLTKKFSYLVELEATGFYIKNLDTRDDDFNTHFHIERGFFDYKFSDYFKVQVGKFTTPIGYWNLVPINVLRDTTSSPLYSEKIFPKFTTGVKFYGFLNDELEYHLFVQKTRDLDKKFNNIQTDNYYGCGLTKEFDYANLGFSIGEFEDEQLNDRVYFDVNLKHKKSHLELLAEAIITKDEHQDGDNSNNYAMYLQSSYNFLKKHYLVNRYEYFKSGFNNYEEQVFLIGYNYRPIYPISIKAEYQLNSHSDLDKIIISLSILF